MSDELTTEIVQLIAASRGAVGNSVAANSALSRPFIPKTQTANVVHVETIIVHSSCGENCSRAITIEMWTIRRAWNSQVTGLAPMFLKNAIRSHLHFSQLNSWISMQNGRLPDGVSCTYRIHLSAVELSRRDDGITEHTFPVCRVDRQNVLVVSVKYVKAEQMPVPDGLCLTIGVLPIDQWLTPSPLESPTDGCPLIASSEAVTISSLKHKPLPPASPPSPDGPSPKFSAIAGPNDERPARRVLSTHLLSSRTENRQDMREVELLGGRLQVVHNDRGRQRTRNGKSMFNKITGLPLQSSPAPVPRQRNNQSTTDIVLPESRQNRQKPNCLLGNFEESALNGRLRPMKTLSGFKLQLAASGSFSSPHTSLPVTAHFFDSNDHETAPSPYLGTCSLGSLGKHGYRVPKQGTIQATLFNPQDTVVKVFVVTYDVTDMPQSSQTFIRQRTFLGNDDDSNVDKHLVNLIHLRLATDRRCRLYLHTDIRMLFSQKNTLDVLNLELESHVGHDSAGYRLITKTELPRHPRYSPK
ncbi:hypothetical protein KIN20_022882 [Parelaphostrongylus tenuis]|uniref:Atos-like conserved domain-containing protein n=1 Tax=Parelaphostrongylus tenuis TaxID=148309 RepID=A0AAD5QV29_PARTN|nr:hypothetical protein KIN20_022882 [Parelaphostrongylus tenuis]